MSRFTAVAIVAVVLAVPAFGQELMTTGKARLRGGHDANSDLDRAAAPAQLRLSSFSHPPPAVVTEPMATLRGALETASHYSPAVQAAQLSAKAADIGVWRSLAEFVPTVEAGYNHTIRFDRGDTSVSLNDPENYLSLTATVPLFTGGQRYHRLKSARAEAEAVAYDAAGVRDDVTEQILGAWMTLASSSDAIDLLGSSRARVQRLKDAVARQVDKGFAARDDLALIAADLAAIDQSIATATVRREQAYNVITRHTGYSLENDFRLPSLERHLPDTLEPLVFAAHRHNPALRAASARYRSERALTRATFGMNLPQVNLTGEARYDMRSHIQSNESTSWRVGVDVKIPLFNVGNWAQTAQQNLLTDAALAREADTLRATEQRILDLWAELKANNLTIKALRSQAENRRIAAVAANRRFQRGFEQLDEAVAREREAKEADLALAETEALHQMTIARLLLAAGLFEMSMLQDL